MTKVRARSDAGCVAKLFVPHAWAVATRCLTAPTIEYPTTHIKYFEDVGIRSWDPPCCAWGCSLIRGYGQCTR